MIPLYTAPVVPGGSLDTPWPYGAAEARSDEEAQWVGYESVHPLTWVPPPTIDA